MTIRIAPIVSRICYGNEEYTPQEVADYITQADGEGFGDSNQVVILREKSQLEFKEAVEKYNLSMDQKLQRDSSEAGRSLSDILSKHSSEILTLIQKGASKRRILI